MDLLAWLARLLLAAVFLHSGVTKLRDWEGALREVRATGLPWPAAVAIATVTLQCLGALALATGVFLREAAFALAAFTLAATLLAHAFWRERGAARHRALRTFLEHLAIAGGLLHVAATA